MSMPLTVHIGDSLAILRTLPSESVHCCVTSPPYWGLRDYGVAGQIGLEPTPQEYVAKMIAVFGEVRRVLRGDGTCWVNLGDSYASIGHKKSHSGYGTTGLAGGIAQEHSPTHRENNGDGLKHKDLCGIPWRVAFALQADGWYLRQDIIWHKPNPMPESVRDRCTKAHEYLFLLAKSEKYYFDHVTMQEPSITQDNRKPYGSDGAWAMDGRNKWEEGKGEPRDAGSDPAKRNRRSVWSVTTVSYKEAHFATFPPKLVEPCILAGCPIGGTVLDPFAGSGTTGMVALDNARFAILIELNPAYAPLIAKRCGS